MPIKYSGLYLKTVIYLSQVGDYTQRFWDTSIYLNSNRRYLFIFKRAFQAVSGV